jgi:tritrans,polycis-undecaprenyl-diphosphate synthase [geranylgeranyl-diphosphate specific]
LCLQIDTNNIPEHLGIILDGNRRWAIGKDKIPWEGHKEGAEKVKKFLEWCLELGIKTVTLYGLSTENFKRSTSEIQELMRIYEENLRDLLNSDILQTNEVRVSAIGRINMLPPTLTKLIQKVEEKTINYDKFYLNVAIAYGGRAEIVDAAKDIALKVLKGEIEPDDVNEEIFEEHLYTSHLPDPDPDLIIRTSGEARLSNFLIWQSAYSELFIVDVYWPDFREIDLMRVIRSFQKRERRYGK